MGIHESLNRTPGFPPEVPLRTKTRHTDGNRTRTAVHTVSLPVSVSHILVCSVHLNQEGSDENMD